MDDFPSEVQKACWKKCMLVSGRDPSRWRRDANGLPVLYHLRDKEGLCGWSFDHIIPVSPDLSKAEMAKRNKLSNCQVLNKGVSKATASEKLDQMEVNESLKDLVELSIYGDLRDEMGKRKCICISKAEAGFLVIKQIPCELPPPSLLPVIGTKCKDITDNFRKAMKHLNFNGKEGS